MLNFIVEFVLKRTRKTYLIPFIKGLQSLGRPSQVLFPTELLEQGLSLGLSGLSNTMSIQSNPDWVWPYWYELQRNPESPAFLPTGMNLVTANLVKRNWTSIGLPHSDREAMVDPVGMVTPRPYGWSAFSYLRFQGQDYFPPQLDESQVHQSLRGGVGPQIITQYHVSPLLQWNSEVHVIAYEGEEFVYHQVKVSNTSTSPQRLQLGLSIRPYNCLTIGHINKLKYKDRIWRINRKPGICLLSEPDQVQISDRHLGDPLLQNTQPMQNPNRTSKTGIISGIAEYDVQLQPGEEYLMDALLYIKGGKLHSPAWISELTAQEIRSHIHNPPLDPLDQPTMSIQVPDGRIQESFEAINNHIHVFDDQTHFSPGTFFYHYSWIRDSAFITMAFHKLGRHAHLDAKMQHLLSQQNKDGFFKSQNGEWDSNGQAIYTLVQHAKYTQDIYKLKDYYPHLLRAIGWIVKQRQKSQDASLAHQGLLPAGFSAEHFGPNDHYYWDNFWALAGIKEVIWAASKLNRINDLDELRKLYQDYSEDIQKNIQANTHSHQGIFSSSPYRQPDSAVIGNMIALWPLQLEDIHADWVPATTQYLWDHNVYQGMFFQKIIHTGLNAYLSAQLAHVFLEAHDSRAFDLIQGILDWASPTYTWPEAIHPRTRGGCMGDGHHGWAAAEWIGLIHHLFISVHENTLIIGSHIPLEWYQSPQGVSIQRASTTLGMISYSIQSIPDEPEEYELKWDFQKSSLYDQVQLIFNFPQQITQSLSTNQGSLNFTLQSQEEPHVL